MTLAETRQLGIEFERRIQTLIPETELENKLDSETIYSYLNQYQDKYIHDIYRSLDQIPSGTKLSAHIESILQSMLTSVESEDEDNVSKESILPVDTDILSGHNKQGKAFVLIRRGFSGVRFELDGALNTNSEVFAVSRCTGDDGYTTLTYPVDVDLISAVNDFGEQTSLMSINQIYTKYLKDVSSGEIENYPFLMIWLPDNSQYSYDDVQQLVYHYSTSEMEVTDPNGIVLDTARSITYTLPENFYMYLRSVSKVSSTFAYKSANNSLNNKTNILPNQLTSLSDVWKLIETPHNSLRILRYPAAVLDIYQSSKPTITIIHDLYTTVRGVKVLYYKQPAHFDIMTSTPCELPMDAFDDIVSGAVDLYVQYAAGAVERRKQQQAAALKRAREDQRDARRSGGNQDEQS